MVRAILDGRKTQTRRAIKHPYCQATEFKKIDIQGRAWFQSGFDGNPFACPYGAPGDRLWVRESFQHAPGGGFWYRAEDRGEHITTPWKPSIHMPRIASRITLEITAVRVERLQDISENDAKAEGVEPIGGGLYKVYQREPEFPDQVACLYASISFRQLWKTINSPGSWEANPWVWVVEFRKI